MLILITLGVFFLMEGITWCTHKYVMHGFGWYLHEDHHQPKYNGFEKNDAFFVIFALPSMALIYFGSNTIHTYFLFIGLGILCYGIAYFLVHDVLIHQRFKWFSRSNNTYIKAIKWAHKMHHKHLGKENSESFGLLFVAKKYWEKVLKDKAIRKQKA